VVEVLKSDKTCGDRLALMAPETPVPDQHVANDAVAGAEVPWWARRAR
jgi:hypothetical protein